MAGSFREFVSSPIFTFQVDHGREKFMVHSGSLAALSPSLHSLMNGEMKEAKLREVNWPDVTKETFVRLCEFAYLRDYTPPAFEQEYHYEVPTSPLSEVSVTENHELWDGFWDGWEDWPPSQRRRKEKEAVLKGIPALIPEAGIESSVPETKTTMERLPFRERNIPDQVLRREFSTLNYVDSPTKQSHQFEPKSNSGPGQNFTPVFSGHAELYILADMYGIESLRQLIIRKLHQIMIGFTIYETNVASIIEFVRFVYQNTPSRTGEIDSLRNLTTRYAASILGQVGDREDFGQLLAEGGDFVKDLWRTIRKTG